MINRTLKDIEQMVSGHGLPVEAQMREINGVSINSRAIQPGNLFIPIIGEKFDGHQFVEMAASQGAVASLWQKNAPNPPKDIPLILVDDTLKALQQLAMNYRNQLDVKVIGITGSNGKTTTKDMTAAIFSTAYRVKKTEGNYNNEIGLPLTILQLTEETEIVILEMGMSSRGEIELLSNIAKPDAAIITNIGESHLQDLGSREEIAAAKLEILAGLDSNGAIIYYGDEPLLKDQLKHVPLNKITFGDTSTCTYYPTFIKQENNGMFFKLNQHKNEMFIPVLGKHNIYNAIAAIAAADFFGIPFAKSMEGLKNVTLTNMRMELISGKNGVTFINDAYNASPTSMKAAVQLLVDLDGYRRKIVVLGDMLELGEQENIFHQEIGQLMNPSGIHFVYTYGRLGEQIAIGAKKVLPEDRVKAFLKKKELIKDLSLLLQDGDIVLVKGSRGMKLEEVIKALTTD